MRPGFLAYWIEFEIHKPSEDNELDPDWLIAAL
jgi:hypothetical protein